MDVGAAERARLVSMEPGVDALGVEGVTAEREQPQLVRRLELGETYGAVTVNGGRRPADDG